MIKLLDHGFVRLVDYMGSDLSIVPVAVAAFKKRYSTEGY